MAFAALLVRVGSTGPIFFRQRRMGRNGREFTLYKFRSMSTCGDNSNGSCITVTGDTRITPVGTLLRRYKLDELPQFWNVLRGDMCLVGPRPKLPHHEALHMASRPGITGAATLAFRNEEDFLSEIPEDQLEVFYEMFVKPTKARLDLEYMRTATLVQRPHNPLADCHLLSLLERRRTLHLCGDRCPVRSGPGGPADFLCIRPLLSARLPAPQPRTSSVSWSSLATPTTS